MFMPGSGKGLEKTWKIGFVETLSFQQIVMHLFTEGTVPVPPNRPFALRLCVALPARGLSLQGDAAAAGGGGLHAVAPQRALRKYSEDFP